MLSPVVTQHDLERMGINGQKRAILRSRGFDRVWYRLQCAHRGLIVDDLELHYLRVGEGEGFTPNEFFAPAWYAERHVDDRARAGNQFIHYLLKGSREGRAPGPKFDPQFYLRQYPDVLAGKIEPLTHYMRIGKLEGRSAIMGQAPIEPCAWFNVSSRINLGNTLEAARPLISGLKQAGIPLDGAPFAVLHLLHQGGGGTERHIVELANQGGSATRHVVMFTKKVASGLELILLDGGPVRWCRFDMSVGGFEALASILAVLKIERVQLHQPREVIEGIGSVIDRLGVPFDIVVNDYSLLCPRDSFVDVNGSYCREPDASGCTACLKKKPQARAAEIGEWRELGGRLLRRAERVLCPSFDVEKRVRRYVPAARTEVSPPPFAASVDRVEPKRHSQRLTVAVLGTCSSHKGGLFLLDCVQAARAVNAPIDWVVIGSFAGTAVRRAYKLRKNIRVTGAYDPSQLNSLIGDCEPGLMFFPQHCVETYSYALSEALASGIPVLVPNIGAFPERVADVAGSLVYPVSDDAARVVDRMVRWNRTRLV